MELKIGQRWEWNNPTGSHFIAEIVKVNPNIVLVIHIYKSYGYRLGQRHIWPMKSDFWTYLEGQDKPIEN